MGVTLSRGGGGARPILPETAYEPTLKKKFVSFPVGGHNCGQSGGRKIFLSFFSPLYRNGRKNTGKKEENSGNMKNICLPGPYRVTRPVDRKQNYF